MNFTLTDAQQQIQSRVRAFAQTRIAPLAQTLFNLKAVVEAAVGRYYPAMTLVEVRGLFDNDALVEIEGIAVIGE